MDILQRTNRALTAAERELATLASEATQGGNYDVASFLIDVAREINSLKARAQERLEGSPENGKSSSVITVGATSLLKQPVKSQTVKAISKKGAYPRFVRQADELIKIGWSPSERSEYEHKSPRKCLAQLVSTIAKVGANGRRFTMANVIPLVDSLSSSPFPDYQVYLCLAWLRHQEIVLQHGRQGYSVKAKGSLATLVDEQWENVPKR